MPQSNYQSWQEAWARVVAQAWTDEAFKKALLADPAATLKAAGVQLPDDYDVEAQVSSGNHRLTLAVPPAPEPLNVVNLAQEVLDRYRPLDCGC